MSYIETYPVQHSTILRIFSEKDSIQMDPHYQRMGGVWTVEKKQLLIDSILNDYDIPKIYLHAFSRNEMKEKGFTYAVIDGRQRLEAIWEFIEGRFTISNDFKFQSDESVKLERLGYTDIASLYPKIKIKFDSFVLPIIGVETDDLDLIEDMFSRLNEAVPLNSAEKRNAIGGSLVAAIREIADHTFFKNRVAFSNRRYQHLEVAARFLFVEEKVSENKLLDTKKEYLDAFAQDYQNKTEAVARLKNSVSRILDEMARVFVERDDLLRAQGNMVLYYLLFKSALDGGSKENVTRQRLFEFKGKVSHNRKQAESNFSEADFELLEFDRLSQQGTNDASNIKERLRVITQFLEICPVRTSANPI